MAWVFGISAQPSDNERVEVTLEDSRRVVSTCQDIITMTTKGRWLMPKRCSLAMAVRHMIGSAQLIGMLNGLGHCSSNSHDTALAHLQMEGGEIYIPENIRVELPATLVWDDNDFGEETLSGKGTTRNTNGIIIQQAMVSDSASLPDTLSRQRTRERSVHPPPLNLLTYTQGKRSGPQNVVFKVDLQQDKYRYAQTTGRRIDTAFFLMKVPEAQGNSLPGWTGFNIMFKKDTILPSTNVGYLPVIDASPTDVNTVHTILSQQVKPQPTFGLHANHILRMLVNSA